MKRRPDQQVYIDILRRMTPEQRLGKAFELGEFAREIFRQGLRSRHPNLTSVELKRLELDRLKRCHNRNY